MGITLLVFVVKQILFPFPWLQPITVGGILIAGVIFILAGLSDRNWLSGVAILVIAVAYLPTNQFLASQGGYAGYRGEVGLLAQIGLLILGIGFLFLGREIP